MVSIEFHTISKSQNPRVYSHIWLEGCTNPHKMEQMRFSENLHQYEYKLSIKKRFHHWTLKLPASMHGQSGPSRLYWPCMLAASFKVQ